MGGEDDQRLGKPSTSRASNAPKELYAYTPSWMTAAERSKLKARIRKIKKKEGLWGMRKEEDALVQRSVESDKDPLGTLSESSDRAHDTQDSDPWRTHANDTVVTDYGSRVEESSITDESHWASRYPAPTSQLESDHDAKKKKSGSRNKSSEPKSKKESLSKKKSKEELTMTKEKKNKPKHPKAVHANPSGNLVKNEKPRTPNARNTLEDHLWVTDFEHFDPRLYSFKTPEKLSTKKPVIAECPPFWVLNDHTIAVAWKLYCKEADRGDLGIVALQWSREFVSAMKDERGEYPIAIKHLLDAIEDGLIYRYSRAAEDSKTAHQKSDDISYASSDSVFKPATEVSYTLRDILSRNFPGRQFGVVQQASVLHTSDTPVVHKTAIPMHDGAHMSQRDILAFLQRRKVEQEARVKHAMDTERQIDKLLSQAKDGKIPKLQSERKDHVGFIGEEDLNKPASAMSHNKSSESAASVKSLRASPVHSSDSQKAAKDKSMMKKKKKKKPAHPGVSVRSGSSSDKFNDSYLEKMQNKDVVWDKSSSPPLESSVELSDSLFNDSKTTHSAVKHGSSHDKAVENDTQYVTAIDQSSNHDAAKDLSKDIELKKQDSLAKKKSMESLNSRKSSKVSHSSKPKKGSQASKSEGKKKAKGAKQGIEK